MQMSLVSPLPLRGRLCALRDDLTILFEKMGMEKGWVPNHFLEKVLNGLDDYRLNMCHVCAGSPNATVHFELRIFKQIPTKQNTLREYDKCYLGP